MRSAGYIAFLPITRASGRNQRRGVATRPSLASAGPSATCERLTTRTNPGRVRCVTDTPRFTQPGGLGSAETRSQRPLSDAHRPLIGGCTATGLRRLEPGTRIGWVTHRTPRSPLCQPSLQVRDLRDRKNRSYRTSHCYPNHSIWSSSILTLRHQCCLSAKSKNSFGRHVTKILPSPVPVRYCPAVPITVRSRRGLAPQGPSSGSPRNRSPGSPARVLTGSPSNGRPCLG